MQSLINSLATQLALRAEDGVGEPVSRVPIRRVGNFSLPDEKVFAPDHSEEHAQAFRGTVYAAVDKIARRIAQLNLNLFQIERSSARDSQELEKTRVSFHPFVSLFSGANGSKPHEEFNAWELKYTFSSSLDTTGESWNLIERDQLGRPARVTPLPSYRMTVALDKQTGHIKGYFYVPKGATLEQGGIFFPKRSWAYLHENPTEPFIWFSRYPGPRAVEDPRGWSPIKAAAYAYDINLYEQIYKRNFLTQGAQLGGVLQSETALSKTQIEEYLEQFKNRHAGFGKAGLPLILPKMLHWTTTEPTPRDMQWAEAINLTQSQILQIYGISDAKLGRADIGNRNTADAMDVTFNREVIKSRCDHIGASLNSDFLPIYPKQTEGLYFIAEFDDPVPGDTEQQLKRERQDIELNVVTRNEQRRARKLPELGKFGDQVFMPLTHVALDPFATTLELSQDDKEDLGFISPEKQAELDKQAAETAAKLKTPADGESGKKKDGAVDPKAADQGAKDGGKRRYEIERDGEGNVVAINVV